MANPIGIQIVKAGADTLTAVTDAELVVIRRELVADSVYPFSDLEATFGHDSDGHYVNTSGDPKNDPAEGEWLLVARKDGCSVVVQRLTFVARDGVLKASAGWGKNDHGLAATVSIVNFDAARGKPVAKQSSITIRLFDAQRFVGAGCRDNHGGTRFTLFAEGRRDYLFDLGKLNAGAVVTLLDCLRNETQISVKSAAAGSTKWVVVHRAASDAPLTILDYYRTLHEIGENTPQEVVEAGIFGHAWHQGPIVQATFDESPDMAKRDDNDADARPKDFYPEGVVATDFPKLPDAFKSDGRAVVWGCSHMVNVAAEAAEANRQVKRGASRTDLFDVVWTDNGRLRTNLDFSKRSIAQYVVSTLRGRFNEQGAATGQCTYGGMMARALKGVVPSFVATPGMGANFGSVRGPRAKDGRQTTHITMLVVDQGENLQLKQYYEREYGAFFERDELLYLDYTKFLDVPLPEPAWSTQRFAHYHHDDLNAEMMRLPSGLELGRGRGAGSGFELPVAFSHDGESGHIYVAKSTTPHSLQHRGAATFLVLRADPTQDVGVFVTETGKSLLLVRAHGSKDFVVPATLPPVIVMELVHDPQYKFPAGKGVPLTSNLLEEVVPKCYW